MKITYYINKMREEENEMEISGIYFSHKKETALMILLNGERKEIYLDGIISIKQ